MDKRNPIIMLVRQSDFSTAKRHSLEGQLLAGGISEFQALIHLYRNNLVQVLHWVNYDNGYREDYWDWVPVYQDEVGFGKSLDPVGPYLGW